MPPTPASWKCQISVTIKSCMLYGFYILLNCFSLVPYLILSDLIGFLFEVSLKCLFTFLSFHFNTLQPCTFLKVKFSSIFQLFQTSSTTPANCFCDKIMSVLFDLFTTLTLWKETKLFDLFTRLTLWKETKLGTRIKTSARHLVRNRPFWV